MWPQFHLMMKFASLLNSWLFSFHQVRKTHIVLGALTPVVHRGLAVSVFADCEVSDVHQFFKCLVA
jgi:hypothetical protein